MTYTHAIGFQGDGDKLHMLQGHNRDGITIWQPICRLDTPPELSCYPIHADTEKDHLTCRNCQRALKKIAMERRPEKL